MNYKNSVAVFCSGAPNIPDVYLNLSRKLGRDIARYKYNLIYGGGKRGMMGALIDGYFENAEEECIYSVIPDCIFKDLNRVTHQGSVILTKTLGERKDVFVEQSRDAIILPGGLGTVDEFFHVLSEKQLCGIPMRVTMVNAFGYFDELLNFIEKQCSLGFVDDKIFELFTIINKYESYESISRA